MDKARRSLPPCIRSPNHDLLTSSTTPALQYSRHYGGRNVWVGFCCSLSWLNHFPLFTTVLSARDIMLLQQAHLLKCKVHKQIHFCTTMLLFILNSMLENGPNSASYSWSPHLQNSVCEIKEMMLRLLPQTFSSLLQSYTRSLPPFLFDLPSSAGRQQKRAWLATVTLEGLQRLLSCCGTAKYDNVWDACTNHITEKAADLGGMCSIFSSEREKKVL